MAREIGTRSLLVVMLCAPVRSGLHRALFYNEQQGYLELFRPYALPQEEWIREAEEKLKRLL